MAGKKLKGTIVRPKRRFTKGEGARGFFRNYPNDKLRIDSVYHLWHGIGESIESNSKVRAMASDGTLVPVCIHKDGKMLVITRDDS